MINNKDFDVKMMFPNESAETADVEMSPGKLPEAGSAKKKSAEELAEAAAEAIIEAADKRAEESDAMEKTISDLEAQIKEMQKKIADNKRKIGRNRKYVLYIVQKKFFEDVVAQMGYYPKISSCKTTSEFAKVTDEMLKKIPSVKKTKDNPA